MQFKIGYFNETMNKILPNFSKKSLQNETHKFIKLLVTKNCHTTHFICMLSPVLKSTEQLDV